jgi:hypothetical protein
MRAVWLRVRAGLRQDWRGLVVLALITGLMGAVVLAVVLCATSVFSLWWTGRLWERPSVRSRVVETVASV